MASTTCTRRRSPRCVVSVLPCIARVLRPRRSRQDEIEHAGKAEFIVKTVLKRLDKNGDGVITLDELESVGLDGLPNFEVMGVEGHHYDVESGMFDLVCSQTRRNS